MKCQSCQFENPDGAKFCIQCGVPMEFRCPNCGAATPAQGKFCMACGHPLVDAEKSPLRDYSAPSSYTPKHLADQILTSRSAVEGERKIVTVLFSDLSGYTAMTERLDPEEIFYAHSHNHHHHHLRIRSQEALS